MSQCATNEVTAGPDMARTGVAGLDEVLGGGLTPRRLFLLERGRCGETVLYVTLSETEVELRGVAQSLGWSLDGISIRELAPQAMSVVKKRGGAHERTIRPFKLTAKGIEVGEPLREFRGVLTGVPVMDAPPAPGT